MSTVGLTKARRRAMTEGFLSRGAMERKLLELGLIEFHEVSDGIRAFKLTPRGHAALAAPRMTQAELACLEFVANDSVLSKGGANKPSDRQYEAADKRGWIECAGYNGSRMVYALTPAGRTALNNVRAAIGSDLWKPDCALEGAAMGSPDWKEE